MVKKLYKNKSMNSNKKILYLYKFVYLLTIESL